MQPFTTHTGIAVPLIKDDINTDQIAPVAAMRNLKPDYKALLFMRSRSEEPDFVLNKPQFREPGILVAGHNFGAGSSRESAVWGMLANNIRVIVAKSFADIYQRFIQKLFNQIHRNLTWNDNRFGSGRGF